MDIMVSSGYPVKCMGVTDSISVMAKIVRSKLQLIRLVSQCWRSYFSTLYLILLL